MARITIGRVLSSGTDSVTAVQGTAAADSGAWPVRRVNTLVPEAFDAVDLTYTGNNLTTVEYYSGGLAGTLVATLTLAYTGSRLDSVVRT